MEEKKEIHHQRLVKKNSNLYYIFLGLCSIIGIILIFNAILTFSLNKELDKQIEETKESLKPARIDVIVLKDSKCTDCFDAAAALNNLKSSQVEVSSEKTIEFDSEEGKKLISQYKIGRIPAMVITGEIDKVNIQGLSRKDNALLLATISPPFTNALSGAIEGRVTAFNIIDSSCAKCGDLANFMNQLKFSGVKIIEEKEIELGSSEGQELVKKFNINFVPASVLSKEISVYDMIKQRWPLVGSVEPDGSYVLRSVNPPFINLTTNKLMGLVNVIYLIDKSCSPCYDVNSHKEILTHPQGFAMRFENEETADISDAKGKELIGKYNITQAPTIILSSDASVYPSSQGLRQFFSIEKDGSYVFRASQVVGAYRDLRTNEVIQPPQQE